MPAASGHDVARGSKRHAASPRPPRSFRAVSQYLKHKDEDGFLYIRYSGENAFGGL